MNATSSSSSWRRLGWEVVVALLLIAAAVAVWYIQDYRWAKEVEAARQEQVAAVEETSEAVALSIFQGFAAGIFPAVTAGETYMKAAVDELIRVDKIQFAHVFLPDGTVLATSDRKLEVLGHGNESSRWVLESAEVFAKRRSDDLWEVGGPLVDPDGKVVAFLWIGCDPTMP